MKTNLATILALVEGQFQVNAILCKDDNWVNHGNDWEAAVLDEAIEAIRSIGYEWWRPAKPDHVNLLIELSDVLAFLLGLEMQSVYKSGETSKQRIKDLTASKAFSGILAAEETFASMREPSAGCKPAIAGIKEFIGCVNTNAVWEHFFLAVLRCGFSIEELLAMYAGKSVLNVFRTENGYREGKYHKYWIVDDVAKEDNYYLAKLVMSGNFTGFNIISPEFKAMASEGLAAEYKRQLDQRQG